MADQVKAPERIWLCPQNYEAATACCHPSDTIYVPESRLAEVRREVWDEAIALAKKVKGVKLNAAEGATGYCDEFASMRLGYEATGAETVVAALEAEAARSKSSPAVKEVSTDG